MEQISLVKRIILTRKFNNGIKTNMNRVVRALNDAIRKERTTVYGVAKAIGVDVSSLYRALKDGGNLGAKSIDKILEHYGYEIRLIKRSKVKASLKSRAKEVKQSKPKSKKKGG
jgi:DNA-binding phage protein